MTLNTTQIPESCLASVSGSTFVNADCFDVFPFIEDKSIDAIICDLPYGTTSQKWDIVLPFDKLWAEYERIIKPNGAIIFTASQPFTTELIMSNRKDFRYCLVWDKGRSSGSMLCNVMPLKYHEDVVVFYSEKPTYNPQMVKCEPHKRNHSKGNMKQPQKNSCYGNFIETPTIITDEKFPTSIVSISKEHETGNGVFPCIIVQTKQELDSARNFLTKTDYYQYQ